MMGFIRKLMLLPRLLKILKLIDPKKLKGLNDILERVYPGIKDEIERLVEHRDIHAMSKTLDYIKAHGGYEKIAEYYNNADQKGQVEMLSAFNEAFRPGAPFEDAVLTLDSLYTQLLGDVKDNIVMTSIKLGYRTIDDWRTFVRRQREANRVVLLGILDEIQEDEETENNENVEEENTDQSNEETGNGSQYSFSKDLISELYEYNNVVFKRISSKYEFACIIQRKPHKEKLVECSGKKVLAYQVLWRLRNLLPEDSREGWINDIAIECGYDVTNISKKYKDETNMRPENKKLLGELSSLFDDYETKI